MTREEQLKLCNICKNQKFDFNQGMICGITNLPANFEISCNSFNEDLVLKIEKELNFTIASKAKRLMNFLFDLAFLMIFSLIFGVILGIVLFFVLPEYLSIFEESKLADWFLRLSVGMIYYVSLEAITGRTLAKFITKTKVINENGEKPNLKTILFRSICRFIPFEHFSFLGSEDTGLHDTLSRTFVVEI